MTSPTLFNFVLLFLVVLFFVEIFSADTKKPGAKPTSSHTQQKAKPQTGSSSPQKGKKTTTTTTPQKSKQASQQKTQQKPGAKPKKPLSYSEQLQRTQMNKAKKTKNERRT